MCSSACLTVRVIVVDLNVWDVWRKAGCRKRSRAVCYLPIMAVTDIFSFVALHSNDRKIIERQGNIYASRCFPRFHFNSSLGLLPAVEESIMVTSTKDSEFRAPPAGPPYGTVPSKPRLTFKPLVWRPPQSINACSLAKLRILSRRFSLRKRQLLHNCGIVGSAWELHSLVPRRSSAVTRTSWGG
jgi:hypothetical protein